MDLTLAICMYNAERYVIKTLESLMNESIQNFHLLIVDDASTDNSCMVVDDFFKKNPRQYELIRQTENHGIAFERNFALNHAKTKYILFLDSDDLFEPTLIEELYGAIASDSDLMGVSCWSDFINVEDKPISGGTFLGEKIKEAFIEKARNKKLTFLPIHTIFNRELAIKAGGFATEGFPEGKPRLQDYCEELDLWTRMSDFYSENKAFIVIPKVLYHYRKAEGLSSNHFNMIIKMRYTKTNLLRRRAGMKELTFVDFYNGLSDKQLRGYRREAKAADNLRNGVFYLKKKRPIKGAALILSSICLNPGYILDKIKHNLLHRSSSSK